MKKALVVGLVGIVALVMAVCASSQSRKAVDQRRFPTHAGKVEKVAKGVVKVGYGKIRPFIWSVYIENGKPGGPPCFDVNVAGPLHEFPGGEVGGPGLGETKCGLGNGRSSQVVTVPIKEGESWQAFDIGFAAYKTPVNRVRLVVSGDGQEEFGTRRLPRDFGIRGLGSLRYAVFAVAGCVGKVQGLEKSHVVATASDWECHPG